MLGDFGATTPQPKMPTRFRSAMAGRHCIESCQGNCIGGSFGLPVRKALLLLMFAALLPACARHQAGAPPQPTTQTIAPAAAKPALDTGTDPMTQTVDVDDSRSEADGMASASSTTPKKAPAKAPAKKKKK